VWVRSVALRQLEGEQLLPLATSPIDYSSGQNGLFEEFVRHLGVERL
jgi:hypothetical protein